MSQESDYFYKKSGSRTCFYVKATRKIIAKKNIPPNINIDDIPQYNNFDEIIGIEKEKAKHMAKFLELQKIINDLDEKLKGLKIGTNWEEEKKKYDDSQRQEANRKRQEEHKRQEEFLKKEQEKKKKEQEEEEKRKNDRSNEANRKLLESQVKKKKILKDLGITNKSQYKQWILKNHPDKNPKTDIEVCKIVMEASKEFLN